MFKPNPHYEALAQHPDKLVGNKIAQAEVRQYLKRKAAAEETDREHAGKLRRSQMNTVEKSAYISKHGHDAYLALPY